MRKVGEEVDEVSETRLERTDFKSDRESGEGCGGGGEEGMVDDIGRVEGEGVEMGK